LAGTLIAVSGSIVSAPAAAVLALAIAGGVASGLGYPRLARRLQSGLLLRKNAQLNAAMYAPERLRAVFEDIADGYSALGLSPDFYLRQISALVLLQEERWSEARAALEATELARDVALSDLITHDNNLAWALAHDGAPREAVALAERTRERADAQSSNVNRSFLDGTLGAALTLDGQHAKALVSLRRAIAAGGSPGVQAVRYYYLGHAWFALGETEEAHRAWERARAEAPASSWARRATERLAAAVPAPYR
jgi:tetratricopeptide (TPR) repeat protein